MRLNAPLAGVAALTLLLGGLAFAQPPGGAPRVRQACAADFQKFCPDATPGHGGGQGKCLKAHAADLSDGCKAAVQARMAARQARLQMQSTTPPSTSPPTGR